MLLWWKDTQLPFSWAHDWGMFHIILLFCFGCLLECRCTLWKNNLDAPLLGWNITLPRVFFLSFFFFQILWHKKNLGFLKKINRGIHTRNDDLKLKKSQIFGPKHDKICWEIFLKATLIWLQLSFDWVCWWPSDVAKSDGDHTKIDEKKWH